MILSPHERMIIRRYMLPGKDERMIVLVAGISLMAVTLAVAALVVVTSVMNGFHGYLFDRIVAMSDHGVIRGPGGRLPDWQRLAREAERMPGVVSARPLVEGRLMMSSRGAVAPALVRGLPIESLRAPAFEESIVAGTAQIGAEGGEVVLGAGLAQRVGAIPGSAVELIRVEEKDGEIDVRPTSYRVAGVIETRAEEIDAAAVLMPLEEAQALLGLGGAVTSIALRTDHPEQSDLILAPLAERLGRGATLQTWKTLNASLFQALALDEIGMFIVLSIIVLVSAFNILSALVMLVRAKTRDIAILRTMGASRGSMLRIFVSLGTAIGALGAVAGLALGLLFIQFRQEIGIRINAATGPTSGAATEFLVGLPAIVEPLEIVGVVFFSLLLSFLATLYPAFTAARTDPVQVLRNS
jgi:lipoprotein-releasing system permease protein